MIIKEIQPMTEKYLTEKIGYYKSLITLLWTSNFVIGSGISWSLVNLNVLKSFIVPTGIVALLILFSAVIFLDDRVRKLLKELNK